MMAPVAIAALAGALLLTACAPPEPAIDKNAVFLELVHDNYDPVSSDSALVDMAKGACTSLKEGATMKEIKTAVAATDLPQAKRIELATMIGYGIGVYCPEFK